jgi:hypothetical protein
MFENLKRKYCVKMFYEWHQNYHKWMNSIANSDLETLEKELEAIIKWKTEHIINEYELDMLNGQEAIVRRLIEGIKKVEGK